MASIKTGKLLYHFTALENIPNILTKGLLPRDQLKDFIDIADKDILTGREQYDLMSMVPFHFFANNPFDGRVCLNNSDKKFVYIIVHRDLAKANNWAISPKHPLNGEFNLLTYKEGMEEINWDVMDKRDFTDQTSKNICMAECLSPKAIKPQDITAIWVANKEDHTAITKLKTELKLKTYVDLNPSFFPKAHNKKK